MKHVLLSFIAVLSFGALTAQTYDTVNVYDIQFVSQSDLANCDDASSRLGDTVTVVGYVATPGNYAELGSGSSATGYRPVLQLVDTTANGVGGPFRGIQIHGLLPGNNNPADILDNLQPGDLVYVTGLVDQFNNETQVYPLGNSFIAVPALGVVTIAPQVITVDELNDNSSTNQLETGEQWEGSYVELHGLTVVSKNTFGSSPERTQFLCQDDNGNRITVYDKFYGMRKLGEPTVNANSPAAAGQQDSDAIPEGARFDTIRGVIDHDENGCIGGTGDGYRISPVYVNDIVLGPTPPIFVSVDRDVTIVSSTDSPTITANVVDADGTVQNVTLYYQDDFTTPTANFQTVAMAPTGNPDEYSATIPSFADGTSIRYYVEATDNDATVSYFPTTAPSQTENSVRFYTVRDNGLRISDVQRVIDPTISDASQFEGEQVTLTGVVTSSQRDWDLGYVHIQDPNETEYAGLALIGSLQLPSLYRHQVVTVTGTIIEDRELTRMQVTSIDSVATALDTITPLVLDPSDAALLTDQEKEKYEGMLVRYENPNGQLYVTDSFRDPFGSWMIGSTFNAPQSQSSEVMTGIQASQNFSSIWVSVVNDDPITNSDNPLQVTAVLTDTNQTMDALIGILTCRFDRYKLTPRNNDDFINFSVALDTAQLEDTPIDTTVSVGELLNGTSIKLFPNPANSQLNIAFDATTAQALEVRIYDLAGRAVRNEFLNTTGIISTADLRNGVYVVRILEANQVVMTEKLVIQH